MTGNLYTIAACLGCNRVFSFNPLLVPTVFLAGVPQAVCRSCLDRVNLYRANIGLPEIVAQSGAYEPKDDE